MPDNLIRLDNALAALSALRNEIADTFPAAVEIKLNGVERRISEIRARLLDARTVAIGVPLVIAVPHPMCRDQITRAPLRAVPSPFERAV